jgi:thimet oligopeptidase
MRAIVYVAATSTLLSIAGCGLFHRALSISTLSYEEYLAMSEKIIVTSQQASDLFPRSVSDTEALVAYSTKAARARIDEILAIPDKDRTYSNTVQAFDRALGCFYSVIGMFEMYNMTCVQELRDVVQSSLGAMKNATIDLFEDQRLYKAFCAVSEQSGFFDSLSKEERYFFDDTMSKALRKGLNLPADKLAQVQLLQKEINELELKFAANIIARKDGIEVTDEELAGVNPDLIKSFKLLENGKRFVGCDLSSYIGITRYCKVAQTRKALIAAYNNRGYPANEVVLKQMLALRHQVANVLGFKSFAALALDEYSAKTPEVVERFLAAFVDRAAKKVKNEIALLASDLPENIKLNADGSFNRCDYAFAANYYKEKHFSVDENIIAQYFPLDKALSGLLGIYQKFFGLTFTQVQAPDVWHESVRQIKVERTSDKQLMGYIFLDLFPRPGKNMHAYCGTISPSYTKKIDGIGVIMPGVAMVSANFAQPQGDKPALLPFSDVSTFFHEFGHAMHGILASTPFMTMSIDGVKTDFVEMPSQMFEEWLFEPEVLREISSHYKTGEPLPADLIERKVALRKFASAQFVLGQTELSLLSLRLHLGPDVDPKHLSEQLSKTYCPYIAYDDSLHHYAAFEHLTGYSAKYYVYLWSRVFAQDVFAHLKEAGLQEQSVGQKFVAGVFGPGGLKDPIEMLTDYLGRAPRQDAFMETMGL